MSGGLGGRAWSCFAGVPSSSHEIVTYCLGRWVIKWTCWLAGCLWSGEWWYQFPESSQRYLVVQVSKFSKAWFRIRPQLWERRQYHGDRTWAVMEDDMSFGLKSHFHHPWNLKSALYRSKKYILPTATVISFWPVFSIGTVSLYLLTEIELGQVMVSAFGIIPNHAGSLDLQISEWPHQLPNIPPVYWWVSKQIRWLALEPV